MLIIFPLLIVTETTVVTSLNPVPVPVYVLSLYFCEVLFVLLFVEMLAADANPLPLKVPVPTVSALVFGHAYFKYA